MCESGSPLVQRTANVVHEMVNDRVFEFTKNDWIERSGMTDREYGSCRMTLLRKKICKQERTEVRNGVRLTIYRIITEPVINNHTKVNSVSYDAGDETSRVEEVSEEISPIPIKLAEREVHFGSIFEGKTKEEADVRQHRSSNPFLTMELWNIPKLTG